MHDFLLARRVLLHSIGSRVAPGAVAEVGDRHGATWREAAGRLSYGADAPSASHDTVFDLASLTKVLATAPLAMRLVDDSRLSLQTRVADVVPRWRGADRQAVTVADLLAHASGLAAHKPLHLTCSGRDEFEQAICSEPLAYPPGSRSLYSDLGFMLLGFLLERVAAEPLDVQFERWRSALWPGGGDAADGTTRLPPEIRFRPPSDWHHRTAPTRERPEGHGIAHDENAAALGGVAGHAGLFGTAIAVGTIARAALRSVLGSGGKPLLASRETAMRFASPAGVPGSSRALGWDTMLPTSSCGARMSARAFGHTGFTGTSLWIDPEAGIYAVLLTNRVYPVAGGAESVTALRRSFHDAVMSDLGFSNRAG